MKKGLGRILVGIVLIVFQIMSILGSLKSGNQLPSFHGSGFGFLYDCAFFISYYIIGIIGLIVLASGVFSYIKYQDEKCKYPSYAENPEKQEKNIQQLNHVTEKKSDLMQEEVPASVEKVAIQPPSDISDSPVSDCSHAVSKIITDFDWKRAIPYILIVILLVVFLANNHQLSGKIEALSNQVSQLQQENESLSDEIESISLKHEESAKKIKFLTASIALLNSHDEKYISQFLNVTDCITSLYHKTGLCKNRSGFCMDCFNRVYE